MSTAPGATAMVAGSRVLELLTPELREIAYNSKIKYATHCFGWISTAHNTRLSHTIETEGLEKPLYQLFYHRNVDARAHVTSAAFAQALLRPGSGSAQVCSPC